MDFSGGPKSITHAVENHPRCLIFFNQDNQLTEKNNNKFTNPGRGNHVDFTLGAKSRPSN